MSVATVEWDGDYSLVGSRGHNKSELTASGEFRREDEQRPTKRRAFHGVPARGWLPTELAVQWRSNDYPVRLTPAAVRRWDDFMSHCVYWGRLAEWHQAADEELAQWDHDRQLLEKYRPELASCFVTDVRGDGDELLRRAMRVRRKAEEYLKALEYGRQVHQQGRQVRGEEYPLDWAKHSQKELLEELDELFNRRWRPLPPEFGELTQALQHLARATKLPVTDAEGFSLLPDRASCVGPAIGELAKATGKCEAGSVDLPVWEVITQESQKGPEEPSTLLKPFRATSDASVFDVGTENESVLATPDESAAEQVVVQFAELNGAESHHVQIEATAWPQLPVVAKDPPKRPASNGKQGRPPVMIDIAEFAHAQRSLSPKPPWKDIATNWKEVHPHDTRRITGDIVRDAYRRHYKRKDKSSVASTQPSCP